MRCRFENAKLLDHGVEGYDTNRYWSEAVSVHSGVARAGSGYPETTE